MDNNKRIADVAANVISVAEMLTSRWWKSPTINKFTHLWVLRGC
jgi:hypothetical protein